MNIDSVNSYLNILGDNSGKFVKSILTDIASGSGKSFRAQH